MKNLNILFSLRTYLLYCIFINCLPSTAEVAATLSTSVGSSKMNILFIVVDDLRPELGVYGVKQVKSPNIDKLAQNGIFFQKAYSQAPICGASRISVLTGMYVHSTKIYGIGLKKKEQLPHVDSLPMHLKKNGYNTVSVGKIYHHNDDDTQAWSKPPFKAINGSGYVTDEAKKLVTLNQKSNPSAGTKGPPTEAADVADYEHHDGRVARRAIDEIENSDRTVPFFLAVGFRKPHLPFTPPKKYWDMYNPSLISAASNPYFPDNFTKHTMNNYGELRNYYGMPRGRLEIAPDVAQHLKHGYYASVTFIDAQIGKILNALKVNGLEESTIVVVFGDHGYKLGEHKSWVKHTALEIDSRVPLIVKVPNYNPIIKSTRSIVELVDLYPTLLDLNALAQPEHLEGESFAPILKNPKLPFKRAALSIWVGKRYRYDVENQIVGYALQTDRYRYIEYQRTVTEQVVARELYDHHKDPTENYNVVQKINYKSTVAKLSKIMKEKLMIQKKRSDVK